MNAFGQSFELPQLSALRATEFPVSQRTLYLNHASDSPIPTRAARTINERTALLQDPALSVRPREAYLSDAKSILGRWLNADPNQFAFLTNVSDATATITNGLDWNPGDEVVLVSGEFASFVYPFRALEPRGVRCIFVPREGIAVTTERITAAITARTKVLAISSVEFQTGYRHELDTLGQFCADRGILFVVDASQSLPALALDVQASKIGALVAVGYKWLASLHGISLLYVAPEWMERIRPTAAGRYSVAAGWETDDYRLDWQPNAQRYQGGALNWIGVCALAESLTLLDEIGIGAVHVATAALASRMRDGLRSLPIQLVSDYGNGHDSQIIVFSLGSAEADAQLVQTAMAEQMLIGNRAHGIRAAAYHWNTPDEIDRFLLLVESEAR